MRKILLLIVYILVALSTVDAQRINRSVYNGYTDEREIETSIVTLKEGFSTGFGVSFRAYNYNLYMSVVGYGNKNTAVSEDERLQFILNDGTVIKFASRVQLPANETAIPNLYIHHYYISKHDVEALLKGTLVIIRKVSLNGHFDLPVKKKHAKDLLELSKVFLKELNK